MLLKLFRPVIKKYLTDLLNEYSSLADSKESISELKRFLVEILNEVLADYQKNKGL